jgi:uncharacterized membrane protein YcaP (DUF421 family)
VDLVLRAIVLFFFLFLVLRVVGRRELTSLEPFEMILLIVMGDLIQQGITQSDYSVTGAALVIITLALLSTGMQYLTFRVPRLEPVLAGEPILIISGGELLERNLRRERMTLAEVEAEARLQQIGDLAEVQYAVLETNGKISFIPRRDSGGGGGQEMTDSPAGSTP